MDKDHQRPVVRPALPVTCRVTGRAIDTRGQLGHDAHQAVVTVRKNCTSWSLTTSGASCWTQWPTVSSSRPPVRPGRPARIWSTVSGESSFNPSPFPQMKKEGWLIFAPLHGADKWKYG